MTTKKRTTVQKTEIRKAFEDAEHPITPQDAWERAREGVPKLGMATVYRTVKELLEEGDLHKVEVSGQAPHYELADKGHHHHFACRVCSRVFDIHGCPGNMGRIVPEGFVAEYHEITVHGICAECQMKTA